MRDIKKNNTNYYRGWPNIDSFYSHFYHSLWIRGEGPFASISWEISSRVVKEKPLPVLRTVWQSVVGVNTR